jgi:hypothetical protein
MSRALVPAMPPVTGSDMIDTANASAKTLLDAMHHALTEVGGTADAVTATAVPDFDDDGLVDGMTFGITWDDTNTDDVTLAINGGTPLPVLTDDGLEIPPGALVAGLRSTLEYIDGEFRVVGAIINAAQSRFAWQITASETLTLPEGLHEDTPVYVECWGAGGGGSSSSQAGGGGGGGYASAVFALGDLGASVTCTIGAGGATGTTGGNGGNTTFGAFLTAYGGQGGSASAGGTGGGEAQAGSDGGFQGGGAGGGEDEHGADASTPAGGGGGGGNVSATPTNGGRAVRGGGGGVGGNSSAVPGTSVHGGAGGNTGAAGQAPGGGGGRNGAGARGEIRVWI